MSLVKTIRVLRKALRNNPQKPDCMDNLAYGLSEQWAVGSP